MLQEPMFRAAGDTAAGAGAADRRQEPQHRGRSCCAWCRRPGPAAGADASSGRALRRPAGGAALLLGSCPGDSEVERASPVRHVAFGGSDIAVDPCMRGSGADVAVDRRGGGPREGGSPHHCVQETIAPCGRRHCAVWQETLLRAARAVAPGAGHTVGDVAAGGRVRSRRAPSGRWQKPLRWAAGRCAGRQEPAPDGKSSCARRQELRSVGRQYMLRRAAGDTVANGKRPCSGPQEPSLRGATGDCALCGMSCAVRQGSKSRCGRLQDVLRAAGHAAASGRSSRTGGRSHTTGAGSVGSARRQETLLRVAGKEPMHRAASVIVPDGSRFCRWQEPLRRAAGAQTPGGKSRCAVRQKLLLLRAAVTVAPGGRRHCANSKAHAPAIGVAALGRKRRCCLRQEPLHRE